jgi:hypothetical protein
MTIAIDKDGTSILAATPANSTGGTWATLNGVDLSAATIAKDEVLTFTISMSSENNSIARSGSITLNYNVK